LPITSTPSRNNNDHDTSSTISRKVLPN
jgi:hypothetical protein